MKIQPRFYRVYPELGFFASDMERRQALKAGQRALRRSWRFWLATIAFSMVHACIMLTVLVVGIPWVSGYLPKWLEAALLSAAVGLGIGFTFQYLWRKPVQGMLREHLLAAGVPICIACGYDLRGNTSGICPECGKQI